MFRLKKNNELNGIAPATTPTDIFYCNALKLFFSGTSTTYFVNNELHILT